MSLNLCIWKLTTQSDLSYQSSGLVVPQINSADEARAVVASTKFPPQGFRGQGSPFPGLAFGVDIPTYIKTANEMIVVALQIESRLGVENVDAICAVEGVGKFDSNADLATLCSKS